MDEHRAISIYCGINGMSLVADDPQEQPKELVKWTVDTR